VQQSFTFPDPDEAERWVPVPDWEGFYEVSNLGRVRSHRRPCRCPHGGRVLKPWLDRNGYQVVSLKGNGRCEKVWVARLVAAVFIGPCPAGQQVRHGPNGKLDNRASQLCYGTRAQQKEDMIRDGTIPLGNQVPWAKLTTAIVAECRQRFAEGETQSSLAREFGVSLSAMHLAVREKGWRATPTIGNPRKRYGPRRKPAPR
jgi:hypothetical protein